MKKITMQDVAKEAGVSQTTVSFVVNNENQSISEEVKERVLKAIDKLGFVPRKKAQNYSKPSDMIIAVFVPNISNLFYPSVIKSLDTYASKKGYRIITISTNRNPANEQYYFRLLVNMKIAGIIFAFTPTANDINRAKMFNIPIVVIGETLEQIDVSTINLNSQKAGALIANHLLNLKHKEIGFITGPTETISLSRKKRLEGLAYALHQKANLTVLTDENEDELENTNYEFEIGYKFTEQLALSTNSKITAIVGANDMICFGILKKLSELKIKVPEEISVCGFDNIFFSSVVSPQLTTVDHCTEQRCRLALDVIDDKISKKSVVPIHVNYDPFLIVRDTSAICITEKDKHDKN